MRRVLILIFIFLATCIALCFTVLTQRAEKPHLTGEYTGMTGTEISKCEQIVKRIGAKHKSLGWHKLSCGLWKDKSGNIAYKTQAVVCSDGQFLVDTYISRLGFNEGTPLKDIVDTATFRELGGTYYKDNNHVYYTYPMSGGGSFNIFEEADYDTFEMLSNCYAKDKNHIYEGRAQIVSDADYATFKTKAGLEACIAQDKNGYFIWGERTNPDEIEDELLRNEIKKFAGD